MVTAGEQLDETQKKWVASLDKMTQVKMFDLSGWEAQARAAEQTTGDFKKPSSKRKRGFSQTKARAHCRKKFKPLP